MSEHKEADFKPYVPAETQMTEFSLQAVVAGAILGIVFGASSLYLVLKVGMTVSASIPVAVLSITLFRWLATAFGLRKTTILENNIVQTAGSAGESIAFGVGVSMPALLIIGFELDWIRVMVVSLLGGLLGILMMIPLRRAFIVQLHGKPGQADTLLYPEGTACAKVLISGDKGGASGNTVFIGFGIAFVHKFLTEGFRVLTTTATLPLQLGRGATDAFSRVAKISTDMASELLGVGYIIGLRTSAIMIAGAVLGGLVIAPTVALQGDPSLTAKDIYDNYLKYIGAGCVAAAGIVSMGKTLPMILRSFGSGLGSLGGQGAETVAQTKRTDRDMPAIFVLGGNFVLLGLLAFFLVRDVPLLYAVLGAGLVLLFGFLFVTVSSRLTGEIGSSSNPISGMTVATLLMTCLIFLGFGMTSPAEAVLALCIGGVVCIAASNGGTTSQDLKTGFLVGATPVFQQWAILIGAFTSAIVIGGTLMAFSSVGEVYSQRDLPDVDFAGKLSTLEKTFEYGGETFHVWQLTDKEKIKDRAGIEIDVNAGKYLVDERGRLRYLVDPTITGKIDRRDDFKEVTNDNIPLSEAERKRIMSVQLSEAEMKRIKHTVTLAMSDKSLVVYKLWTNNKAAHETASNSNDEKVLEAAEPYSENVPDGEYLVDAQGKVAFKNFSSAVTMKFPAPKTQVMGIIINGLLKSKLNWALVLIGAFIAITLELCGISSLAFAVGLYIPMQYSTPIFIGGVARWLVDTWHARRSKRETAEITDPAARAEAEVKAIAESESSPAVLLASGLIAGGSLAGVVIAFMQFLPPAFNDRIEEFGNRIAGLFLKDTKWDEPGLLQQFFCMVLFLGMACLLPLFGMAKSATPKPDDDPESE